MSCSVTIKNLALRRGDRALCDSINLELGHKEKIAVIGHNGSGKTTLLETIVGLCPREGGEIRLFDSDTIDLQNIGYLLQDSDDQFLAPIVEDDVAFSLLARGYDRKYAAEKTTEVLTSLGVERLAKQVAYRLSGGEKKLVALAGALITNPKLLLLDEPTAALDYEAQLRLAEILKNLDVSMIIASHDREFLESVVHRFYMLAPRGLELIDGFEGFAPSRRSGP
ncbi:MAG: energy-coupling factor ABC transporter ATP-binding protein [Helicobacteraceae bacterium]|jgi:cobalt/nickel transport system ATP-binding protein|nr:energy-coupling factor ABC transporter ATP-binding protein [Helicobacteraceae bacterium]